MCLFDDIKPIYIFWKTTGLIAFTFKQNEEIVIAKQDKKLRSILLAILTSMVVLNIYFAIQQSTMAFSQIFYFLYVCSISMGLLLNYATIQYRNNLIIDSLKMLSIIDQKFRKAECSKVSKFFKIFLLYIIVFIATATLETYFFLKSDFSIARLFNFLFYYFAYVFDMSASLLILFFLKELVKRFRIINKNIVVEKVFETFYIHRYLRDVSKKINTAFEGVMLGKVMTSLSIALFTVFHYSVHWKEIVASGQYAIMVSGTWCIGYILEIMAIVHYFSAIKYEVSCYFPLYS